MRLPLRIFSPPPPPPPTMKAVELTAYAGAEALRVVEKPVPRPGPGEVIVKMAAAPLNPSDLAFIRGLYGFKKALPTVPGFEGSGRVVAAGPTLDSPWGRALLGRRVAVSARAEGDGTWAEYLCTAASQCIPLLPRVSDEQGAALLVNPLTAWALVERAKKHGHRAIAHTAAASALGRLLLPLARRAGLTVVHVVRRSEQVDLLAGLGAEHVLDSSAPDFDAALRDRLRRLGVRLAYDAVAGALTGKLLDAMPRGGRVTVYGALSEQACVVVPGNLIFGGKRVDGFWLSDWLRHASPIERLRAAAAVQALVVRGELHTEVRARHPLEEAREAIGEYAARMTGGKVLLVPSHSTR